MKSKRGKQVMGSGAKGAHARPLLKRLTSSGGWTLAGRFGGTVGSVLVLAVITRLLTLEVAGVYLIIHSVVMFGSILATFGLGATAIRVVRPALDANDIGTIRRVVRRAVTICWLASVVVGAGLFALVLGLDDRFAHGHLRPVLGWVVAWMAVAAASQLLGEIYRGLEKFNWSTLVGGRTGGMLTNPALAAVLLAVGYYRQIELREVLIWHVAIASGFLAIAAWRLWSIVVPGDSEAEPTGPPPGTEEPTTFWLLKEAWPVVVSQSLSMGIVYLDLIVLGTIGSEQDAAMFGSARRLMVLVGAPLQILNVALAPFIVQMHAKRQQRQLESLLRVSATAAALPALVCLFVIAAAPGKILELCFGSGAAAGAGLLLILAIGNMVFVLCGNNGMALRMTGHQRSSMYNGLLTGGLYLLTLPLVIEWFGVLGAAWSASAVMIIRNIVATLLVRNCIGVWPLPIVWLPRLPRELRLLRRQPTADFHEQQAGVTSSI